MISIGAVFGGVELKGSSINRVITVAMKAAMELAGEFQFGTSPAVNVVFHVPGSMGAPDWTGIRDAKFSRKQQLLMVQVATPKKVLESPSPEDFVVDSLYGANAVAFEFFRVRGLEFPLADAEALVAEIASRLQTGA